MVSDIEGRVNQRSNPLDPSGTSPDRKGRKNPEERRVRHLGKTKDDGKGFFEFSQLMGEVKARWPRPVGFDLSLGLLVTN